MVYIDGLDLDYRCKIMESGCLIIIFIVWTNKQTKDQQMLNTFKSMLIFYPDYRIVFAHLFPSSRHSQLICVE